MSGLTVGAMRSPPIVVGSFSAFTVVTAACGIWLRRRLQRLQSLRATVYATALSALVLALAAAILAGQLMLIQSGQLRLFLIVLGIAAAFASLLAAVVARPLAVDVARLGEVANRVEHGDLSARTGIERPDELGHAARALDQAVERLAQLERERAGAEAERRAMLTSISHDLRTPLAAMRAAIEALTDGVAPDPERYEQAIQRDLAMLEVLIDDLFLLARIEAGQRSSGQITLDLAEIADESVEALAPVADRRGVTLALSADGPSPVTGSAAELGRVLRNLLDNAIRYAPCGSTVTVGVRAGPPVTVLVRDEGPGFPPEFAARAFDPFTRSDTARNRATGGAGLGLAIARGLVEAHGGSLRIEHGRGGCVAITLPGPTPVG